MGHIKFDKKKLEQFMYFLFNFNTTYVYTFIAGILVSLAVNLLTTALLAKNSPVSCYRIYKATIF